MPTSQVPDEDAAMRMFSRKLRYLLANLCDLLDFWFARMKQRKASPRIAARHCNHAQVTASCPSEVTIGLPTMIFSFLFIMSDVPLPSWLFSWKKHTHTHTYIYIYIHWFPLEKLKVFMLQRISWDWGKEPFLAFSTELFFTLRGVPPANACASRHTGNLKLYALSLGLLPVTGGTGFGRDSMVVGNLELWNLLLV